MYIYAYTYLYMYADVSTCKLHIHIYISFVSYQEKLIMKCNLQPTFHSDHFTNENNTSLVCARKSTDHLNTVQDAVPRN